MSGVTMRKARRLAHLAWLEAAMAENAERLEELRAIREAPCSQCVADGIAALSERKL